MADEERKIIIDEDWKAQVQREKEKALHETEKPEAAAEQEQPQEGEPGQEGAESLFQVLVTSLAAQAMYALGMVAPPDAQQVMVDLGQAKFVVDSLLMLREKTEGHLTPVEQGHLAEILGELQRLYVFRAQQVQEAALRKAGVNPMDLGKQP
jgi:hypothetical protein